MNTHTPSRQRPTTQLPTTVIGFFFVALLALLAALSGCSTPADADASGGSTPGLTVASNGTAALTEDQRRDCATVFAAKPVAADNVIVVADLTASRVSLTVTDDLAADLEQASLAGGSVTLIAVNGAGAAPAVLLKNAGLSSDGPRDAPSVKDIASHVPMCVADAIANGGAPTAAGTDFYPAAAAAAELITAESSMWWLTDMALNAGQIDLSQGGLLSGDAAAAAGTVSQTAPLDLKGVSLHLAGIANSVTPYTPQGRQWLTAFTTALCQAWNATGCDGINREPEQSVQAGDAGQQPQDAALPFPTITTHSDTPAGAAAPTCTFSVPGALTFDGDSPDLRADAAQTLQDPINLMATNPNSTAIITGHTATPSGPPQPESLVAFSILRAENTKSVFVANEIGSERITVTGVGDSQPLAEDIDPATGQQIPDVAAAERRVDITITGAQCP